MMWRYLNHTHEANVVYLLYIALDVTRACVNVIKDEILPRASPLFTLSLARSTGCDMLVLFGNPLGHNYLALARLFQTIINYRLEQQNRKKRKV